MTRSHPMKIMRWDEPPHCMQLSVWLSEDLATCPPSLFRVYKVNRIPASGSSRQVPARCRRMKAHTMQSVRRQFPCSRIERARSFFQIQKVGGNRSNQRKGKSCSSWKARNTNFQMTRACPYGAEQRSESAQHGNPQAHGSWRSLRQSIWNGVRRFPPTFVHVFLTMQCIDQNIPWMVRVLCPAASSDARPHVRFWPISAHATSTHCSLKLWTSRNPFTSLSRPLDHPDGLS